MTLLTMADVLWVWCPIECAWIGVQPPHVPIRWSPEKVAAAHRAQTGHSVSLTSPTIIDGELPEWVRRAQEKRLVVKEWAHR